MFLWRLIDRRKIKKKKEIINIKRNEIIVDINQLYQKKLNLFRNIMLEKKTCH